MVTFTLRIITIIMMFECHVCNRTFKTKCWLTRHINADHPTLGNSSDIDNSSKHVEYDCSSSISAFSMPCYHTNLQENNIHLSNTSNMNASSSSQSSTTTCNSEAMDIDLPPQSDDANEEDASISIRSSNSNTITNIECNNNNTNATTTAATNPNNNRNDNNNILLNRMKDLSVYRQSTPTNKYVCELKLLSYVSKHHLPLYAYNELMILLHDINSTYQHSFLYDQDNKPTHCTRDKLITYTAERHCLENYIPKLVPMKLSSDIPHDVVQYDFMELLWSLLSDDRLMTDENLEFPDNTDPTKAPLDEYDILDQIHTGSWYKEAYDQLCTNPTDVLLPIVGFIDQTHCDKSGKLKLEPIKLTLGIFNRSTRNTNKAWRTLGFVQDMSTYDHHSILKKNANSESHIQDYHLVLESIFNELKNIQQSNGINWTLQYKGGTFNIVFKVVIAFIIGDTIGHDKLCGKKQGARKNMKHCCRYCHIDYTHLDSSSNTHRLFKLMKRSEISSLYEKGSVEVNQRSRKRLKKISYHYVCNAFDGLCFGNDRGINGATPFEILHAVLKGLFEYNYDAFMEWFGSGIKTTMSKVCVKLGHIASRQCCRDLPRIHFPNGIETLSKVTADENSGIILLLLIFSITSHGRELIDNRTDMEELQVDAFVVLFCRMLQFEKFLKLPSHKRADIRKAKRIMPKFMELIKRTFDRTDGQGMKIIKFHDLIHIMDDILRFGSHQNYNSGPSEHTHKMHKDLTHQTQRRVGFTFNFQSAKRESENFIIQKGVDSIDFKTRNTNIDSKDKSDTEDDNDNPDKFIKQGSKCTLEFSILQNTCEVIWTNKQHQEKKKYTYPTHVLKYIYDTFKNINGITIRGYTEMKRKGLLIRADPSYRSEKPCYFLHYDYSLNNNNIFLCLY